MMMNMIKRMMVAMVDMIKRMVMMMMNMIKRMAMMMMVVVVLKMSGFSSSTNSTVSFSVLASLPSLPASLRFKKIEIELQGSGKQKVLTLKGKYF